jgi:uncharacterized membrane protein
MSNTNHKASFQLERIALFSDAVFAIAITLLIIEIKVPPLPFSNPAFSDEFSHAMKELIPEFIGFTISFMVIGSYWRAHHLMFNFVEDYDRKLLQLNSLLLLTIVVMPFTTAFMSRYLFFQPFFIYCLNVIASGLLELRLWRHITSAKNHLHTTLPPGVKAYKTATTIVTIGCFFLAMVVHQLPFLSEKSGGLWARIFLAAIFLINLITDNYYQKKYKLGKKY